MNSLMEVSMNDDAHKFTSDASETNSLENAKKLKENRLRCRILKPLLRYPFNSITKIKQRKRRRTKNFFSFIGVGFLTVSCLISIRYDSHDLAFIPTQKAQKHLQRHHCMQRTGPF